MLVRTKDGGVDAVGSWGGEGPSRRGVSVGMNTTNFEVLGLHVDFLFEI